MAQSAKYQRLPTEPDQVDDNSHKLNLDFSSAFTYGTAEKDVDLKNYSESDTSRDNHFTYTSFTKQIHTREHDYKQSPIMTFLTGVVTLLAICSIVLTAPVSLWFCFKSVKNYQRALLFRLGRMTTVKRPGLVFTIPCLDKIAYVDMRTKAFNVPPQAVSTKDRAIIELGADVRYRVQDPVKSFTAVQDFNVFTRRVAQSALVSQITQRELRQITSDRLGVNYEVQKEINGVAKEWGLEIISVEISQVKVLQEPDPALNSLQQLLATAHVAMPPGMPGVPQAVNSLMQSPLMQQMMSQLAQREAGAAEGMQQVEAAFAREEWTPAPQMGAGDGSGLAAPAVPAPESANEKPALTADELMRRLRPHLSAGLSPCRGTCYRIDVTGEKVYHVDLKSDPPSVGAGEPGVEADATLCVDVETFRELLGGSLNPTFAYVTQRLKVTGELSQVIKLGETLSAISSVIFN